MMMQMASCRLLRSKWRIRSPTGAANPDKPIAWGQISARGCGSQYDEGFDVHVQGKARSSNRAAPRGLIRGFANEEKAPPLPSYTER
ncbi:hypothetical protein JKF63_01521 [Porcisia hertigi]|uniref:Uncharacterized protein n=1 Tax=Porcisia hertigi TaxID=2761500 RepID=A0A836I9H3_9TRYP|nr:hypothetical protein JKF63_01521 [Porcisia hertigi]